jgi:succinate dehydrogenase / fumarate reductase cytochrome b subunit
MAARSLGLYDTAIGKKAVMAMSGVVLLGFVFTHMAGNLLVFKGADAMNAYAIGLRELLGGAGIWIARAVLITAVGAHIWSAMALSKQNRDARPVPYKRTVSNTSSHASKTMMFGGITLLLYIAYHIAHLTFGVTTPN